MSKIDLEDRFHKSLEDLYEEENYLAIQFCRLGIPKEADNSIPTACVSWNKSQKKIEFLFNVKFASILSDEEFKFVTAHEAIHLLNGHVPLLKSKLERMEREKKSEKEMIRFQKKFGIAADCVVNDSLINLYGFNPIMTEEKDGKPKIIYGMDMVKTHCHDLSVMDVFYLLDDQELEKRFGNLDDFELHDWRSFFDENGNLIEEFANKISRFFSSNSEKSSLSDEDLEKIEKLRKHFEKNNPFKSRSDGRLGVYRPIDNSSKIYLNWNKILFEMIEIKKQSTVWHRPPNKLRSVYPDVILPSLSNIEKEDLFIAVDSSGSIDYDMLSIFIGVLKGIQNKFNIKAISFDDDVYEYDILKDDRPKGGGGTNFQIISDYIDGLKKYPKTVIVMTDGYGTPIGPKYPNKWHWLLYGGSSTEYCKNMKHFFLNDMIIK